MSTSMHLTEASASEGRQVVQQLALLQVELIHALANNNTTVRSSQ